MRRVVITGMGIYSCIGTNLDSVRQSLYNGVSGIGTDPSRKDMGFRSLLTGIVPPPDVKAELNRHQRALMPEEALYAYCATKEALTNAKLTPEDIEKEDVGLIYGNDSTAQAVIEGVDRMRLVNDTTLCGLGTTFKSMNSTVTMNLGCIFHLKGINMTISSACSSGSHSIGLGTMLIRNGMQDMIVVGGAQETNSYAVGAFDGTYAFSVRMDEPTKASRPFDKNRDGLVPSGGAATIVLEEYEHAVKRGADILGEVIGWGFSANGDHISAPNVEGPEKSIRNCISNAGIDIREISYINAHATSTPLGDSCEAKALHNIFGDIKVPVTSTKSMTGHEMWMSGTSDVIYSMLMMQNGFIAPNLNFEEPDDDSANLYIPNRRLDKHFDMFLANSFGFGGTNSTLIIKNINTSLNIPEKSLPL
ncbi:MAG: beta-ketoacyl-[acyl-carrier-protein] synthase family protein [Paludibacteraceae bacterium]|nr:beta-ketoacyl-[acyl-carrier-protein] synthase family protein [Paludibacteraceae bacterium]